MAAPSTSDAALKLEIAKLTGAINQRRSTPAPAPRFSRTNTYVNASYKPPSSSYVRPGYAPPTKNTSIKPISAPVRPPAGPGPLQKTRDVTIDGVEFETSRRSLVRKESASGAALQLNVGPSQVAPPLYLVAAARPPPPRPRPQPEFSRTKNGHLIKSNRVYKPKGSRHQNMTLNNGRRPFQSRRVKKSIDKPCPAFNTTGTCTRGLTCAYKHDPSKIAICWPFLQGTCPHSADTCALSHDPTPERTPLCVHFANHGRCTRTGCPFPHVAVGTSRSGVCRDFAVLGYCEKGVECAQQHVRECPDFAERGVCGNKRCKLPHVIRANRVRKATGSFTSDSASTNANGNGNIGNSSNGLNLATAAAPIATADSGSSSGSGSLQQLSAENARLGDEYISLTFNESESEEEESNEDEEEGDDDDGDGDGEDDDEQDDDDVEEGSGPSMMTV